MKVKQSGVRRSAASMLVFILLTGPFVATLPGQESEDASKPGTKPTVEVAKELPLVQGVTIKRHLGPVPSGSQQGCWENPRDFKTAALPLVESLQYACDLPPTRIQGVAHLPEGLFNIEVRNEDPGKDVYRMLYEAIGQRFGVRVSLKTQETDVLVLTTTEHWAKKGFKVNGKTNDPAPDGTNGDVIDQFPPTFFSQGGFSGEGTEEWACLFANVDMDRIAVWVESTTKIPVVNETNLAETVDGKFSITYREPNLLPNLQKALARHGLSLTRTTRQIKMLVIESLEK